MRSVLMKCIDRRKVLYKKRIIVDIKRCNLRMTDPGPDSAAAGSGHDIAAPDY